MSTLGKMTINSIRLMPKISILTGNAGGNRVDKERRLLKSYFSGKRAYSPQELGFVGKIFHAIGVTNIYVDNLAKEIIAEINVENEAIEKLKVMPGKAKIDVDQVCQLLSQVFDERVEVVVFKNEKSAFIKFKATNVHVFSAGIPPQITSILNNISFHKFLLDGNFTKFLRQIGIEEILIAERYSFLASEIGQNQTFSQLVNNLGTKPRLSSKDIEKIIKVALLCIDQEIDIVVLRESGKVYIYDENSKRMHGGVVAVSPYYLGGRISHKHSE